MSWRRYKKEWRKTFPKQSRSNRGILALLRKLGMGPQTIGRSMRSYRLHCQVEHVLGRANPLRGVLSNQMVDAYHRAFHNLNITAADASRQYATEIDKAAERLRDLPRRMAMSPVFSAPYGKDQRRD